LYHSVEFDCAAKYKVKYPGLMLYRNFDTPFHPYNGDHSLVDYNEFIRKLMFPSMFEFTEAYIENVFEQGRECLILFHDEELGKPDYWFTYKEAAFNHKDLIAFSYVGKTHPYA